MLQASSSISRNANILFTLDHTTTTRAIKLYQPGQVNPNDVFSSLRYSGFITALRMVVDITSIQPVDFPTPPVGATDEEVQSLALQLSATNPTKTLSIYLHNTYSGPVKVADISLFNRRPYYLNNLMPYLTDTDTFDVASDTVLSVQMRDTGNGLLSGSDRIVFIGSAVEETAVKVPAINLYVTGGSSTTPSTDPPPTEEPLPPQETYRVLDSLGNLVVDNAGNPVRR